MENYIVINGNKAELTKEQLKSLGIEIKNNDPFKLNEGDYYYINSKGNVGYDFYCNGCVITNKRHDVANYCTNKELIEKRILHENLNRLLWRYSMRHDGDKIKWCGGGYKIFYNHKNKIFDVSGNDYFQCLGTIYFLTKEIAESAIREIVIPFMEKHPDFKW